MRRDETGRKNFVNCEKRRERRKRERSRVRIIMNRIVLPSKGLRSRE